MLTKEQYDLAKSIPGWDEWSAARDAEDREKMKGVPFMLMDELADRVRPYYVTQEKLMEIIRDDCVKMWTIIDRSGKTRTVVRLSWAQAVLSYLDPHGRRDHRIPVGMNKLEAMKAAIQEDIGTSASISACRSWKSLEEAAKSIRSTKHNWSDMVRGRQLPEKDYGL